MKRYLFLILFIRIFVVIFLFQTVPYVTGVTVTIVWSLVTEGIYTNADDSDPENGLSIVVQGGW